MIADTLDRIHLYKNLHPRLAAAIEYLQATDFENMSPGKYNVAGDDVFAIVNEYSTKDKAECELEAHRKYIDIQYMVKGTELCGYVPLAGQVPVTDYHADNDVAIYTDEVSYTKLEAGMFILFFPTDLHQPEVRAFEPMLVKKVVMKIKV